MEAHEEEGELGDLFAEILENWNTPIYSEMVHQNPFSTAYDYDYDSDVEQVVEEQLKLSSSSMHSIVSQRPTLSGTHVETSKRKYEGDKVKDKGGRGREKLNSSEKEGMDGSIIPVLVADTFYDKLLGHGADGTDIQALVKMEEAETYAHAHNRTRMPIRSEYRVFTQRYFVRRLGVMLSSNKKINIDDDFGEKMWRNPGADTTDFFNYGLDEKRWKDYCKEMARPSETDADTSTNSIEGRYVKKNPMGEWMNVQVSVVQGFILSQEAIPNFFQTIHQLSDDSRKQDDVTSNSPRWALPFAFFNQLY
ncbi:FIP1[V]-like protein [Perilla frutescens var. frutescens]|nr:FIP1[V]-like protein [Perilla frutescens var. frutescens]